MQVKLTWKRPQETKNLALLCQSRKRFGLTTGEFPGEGWKVNADVQIGWDLFAGLLRHNIRELQPF